MSTEASSRSRLSDVAHSLLEAGALAEVGDARCTLPVLATLVAVD